MKTLLFALIFSTSAFSATTGTLLLQGVVPQKISVAVTPTTAASALDLTTTQSDLVVASVNEKSNSKTGYKVTITSANLGNLKRVDGSDVFSYTMKYGGSAVNLTSVAGTTLTSTSTNVNLNKDMSISYTGASSESMTEGTYSDIVSISISAN